MLGQLLQSPKVSVWKKKEKRRRGITAVRRENKRENPLLFSSFQSLVHAQKLFITCVEVKSLSPLLFPSLDQSRLWLYLLSFFPDPFCMDAHTERFFSSAVFLVQRVRKVNFSCELCVHTHNVAWQKDSSAMTGFPHLKKRK